MRLRTAVIMCAGRTDRIGFHLIPRIKRANPIPNALRENRSMTSGTYTIAA